MDAKLTHAPATSPKSSSESTYVFALAFGFLTFNTVSAVVRMREDILAVAFNVSLYLFLIIFFLCLSAFEKLPQDSMKREWLKVPVWALATTLNFMFAYRVWTIVRPATALGCLVWGMAGTTSLITFYFFFVYGETKTRSSGECDSKAACDDRV